MAEFLSQAKPYLEVLYYLSMLSLAIVGAIGLRQIFLLKYDIRTRNLRAANKEAIALIDRYLEKYVAIHNKHYLQLTEDHVPKFDGEVGDFSLTQKSDLEKVRIRFAQGKHWLDVLNELEIIAAGINSKLANEELTFLSFGKSFCSTVESSYDIISFVRSKGTVKYCNNIVDLYRRWHARIKQIELERKKDQIDDQLRKTVDEKFESIGTNLK